MSGPLRLIIFDVDGTLVDSQNSIVTAMTCAFQAARLPVPERALILGTVGLSLPLAVQRLVSMATAVQVETLVSAYKSAYFQKRSELGAAEISPFYPGALEGLKRLYAVPEYLLGIATGKSRRGLDRLLDAYGLHGHFVTKQVSDHHPSKPHPAMIEAALAETGIAPGNAVMIGDTSFDMEMAQAAGVTGIGVSWGYHGRGGLGAAAHVIDRFEDLPQLLDRIWEGKA